MAVSPEIFYSYPQLRERDPRLWALLKTGELIAMTAIQQGFELPTSKDGKGDEWINCLPERVMGELRLHGDLTARKVLKETRRLVNSSQDLVNGNRQLVFEAISGLMRTLGRSGGNFELPPIPTRPVEKLTAK